MKRRRFLTQGTLGLSTLGIGGQSSAELSPTDLRPAKPIGLAKPDRRVTKDNISHCRVADPRAVKILQCTDVHLHCDRERYGDKADQRTREDIKRLVDQHQPNLIAFTGDVWHDPEPGKSEEIFADALSLMVEMDTPWLFNWGNHDLQEDYGPAQGALTEAPKSLYRGGYQGGNYRVRLDDAAGKPLHELICLNTTTQGIQAPQEDWLKKVSTLEDRSKHSLCFLHIPIQQYIDVWKAGSANGVKQEEVCTYGEDGSAFTLLKKLGVTACFCGHDHVNDYAGTHDGIAMVYGRATGHAGYGSDKIRKGGKLITLNTTSGRHTWKTVFANGKTWVPSEKVQ
ncbi:metallophosphoesterase [Verrucomicrobiales bacterium]|nr:metallophosphoesterase [Verrucomicrobiales bacterium]MDA7666451.1 metallophosphoesterase [bacterium]MDB4730060.1 metallophosphoesterase [bacterium]